MRYEILVASTVSPPDRASSAHRIILCAVHGRGHTEYAVWFQTMHDMARFWGFYTDDRDRALETYMDRCERTNVEAFPMPDGWEVTDVSEMYNGRFHVGFENPATTEYFGAWGNTPEAAKLQFFQHLQEEAWA